MPQLPQLAPLEVSSGMVFGSRIGSLPASDRQLPPAPRAALERILLKALRHSPCVVAFSGGRDSSALLAEAVRVARAHGLADPIAHTLRLGEAPRSREDEWQEAVVRHVGLREWSKQDVTTQLDLLGPLGASVLRSCGVHWPPNAHTLALLLGAASGGTLITGDGGDELFSGWRWARASLIARGRLRPRRRDMRAMARWLLPEGALARLSEARHPLRLPWLTREAQRRVGIEFAREAAHRQRSWAAALEGHLASRALELALAVLGRMAEDSGARLVQPFFDPAYVRAVAAAAPREGYLHRRAAMEANFGDVLPARLLGRSTKAVFTEAFWGPRSRRFAREWRGGGLDPSLVDAEAVRREWLSPVPDLRSLVPLQAAWLAERL